MPLNFAPGDPTLSQADMLAFGHNARGRTELGALETHLMQQYAPAFSAYTRRARQGKQKPGTWWLWTETRPKLAFLTIRDSSVGATRLRYVQSVLMTLARDYPMYQVQSLAIAPLGNSYERDEINKLAAQWLAGLTLPITLYTAYIPGVEVDDGDVGSS